MKRRFRVPKECLFATIIMSELLPTRLQQWLAIMKVKSRTRAEQMTAILNDHDRIYFDGLSVYG